MKPGIQTYLDKCVNKSCAINASNWEEIQYLFYVLLYKNDIWIQGKVGRRSTLNP